MQAVIESCAQALPRICTPDGTVYEYTIDETNRAIIEKCSTSAKSITIPAFIDGYAVVALADRSFEHLSQTESITCPHTLRSIGRKAFSGCIKLCTIALNDGLISIEDEAFELCMRLSQVFLPASVENIGCCIAGGQAARSAFCMNINISHDNPYLFARENVIYQNIDGALQLIDGTRFNGEVLNVVPGTRGISKRALYLNRHLKHLVLPEGLIFVGDEALRGCSNLTRIDVPESLEEIGRAAVSCTSLESIYLPAACVRVHERALDTGAVLDNSEVLPYESTLKNISVHPCNPAFCMCGNMLCKRIEGTDQLHAFLCPRIVDTVELSSNIASVAKTAFAGTVSIEDLRISDSVVGEAAQCMIAHSNCQRIDIELSNPLQGKENVSLELPEGALGASVLDRSYMQGRIDASLLLAYYDEAILQETNELSQASHMIARLADPVQLDEDHRARFTAIIENALESVCVHFGARSMWASFDCMADAGLIDSANIPSLIHVLTEFGDAPAVSYLLALRHDRFDEAAWDYAL